MFKSIGTMLQERLSKGGVGSGRYPAGSGKTTPQERLKNKVKFRRDSDMKHLTGYTPTEFQSKFGTIQANKGVR